MAKKILSILCALAMMVTMVSVAAFSASAADSTTTAFPDLSEATITYTPSDAASKYGDYQSEKHGSYVVAVNAATANVALGQYNIDNAFDLSFTMDFNYNSKGSVVLNVGDLVLTVSRSSGVKYTVDVSYNGESIGSKTAAGASTTATYYAEDINEDDSTYDSAFITELKSLPNGTRNLYGTSGVGNYKHHFYKIVCTYSDGSLTAGFTYGTSSKNLVTVDLPDADFSAADVSIVVNDTATAYHRAIYDFTGTYAAASTSGGEGGETTNPLAPTGVYPTLNSDLTLNVIYANAADYKDTVEVTATVDGKSQTVGLTEKGGNLVASFDFLTPDQFGSEITLEAVDTNGVAETYSTTYSVKQYCKNMMDNDSSSDELKALCMALLQFGDSVAVYNGGSTFLSDMADYVSAYAPAAWTQGTAAWTYTGTANGAEWVGANLNFADEIGINVYFTADGDASDYYVEASFGNASDVIVDGDNFMATIRISSSFLSNQNEVTVMSAEGVISEVFTLSVEDWVNANIGKMDDAKKACAIALMTYGDAAAAYGN